MSTRSRREFLRVGGLSLTGLALPDLLRGRALSAAPAGSFGKAKACILLFMWGGPSQLETWDMKPDAPEQVRGEFKPIATETPGLFISEHFSMLARQTRRLAVVRSVHHADVNHTTATHDLLTGRPIGKPGGGTPEEDWPNYGAVLAHLNRGRERSVLPPFVQMRPTVVDGAPRFVEESHGQGAGWLGRSFNPFTIDRDPNQRDYDVGVFKLPDDVGLSRMGGRGRLREEINAQARAFESNIQAQSLDAHYAKAYRMLASRQSLEAFELEKEDPRLRERYGLNPHGQAVLQARRLIEAGVPLATVFWQNDGLTNVSVYWDTHNRNFVDLKTRLMPPADQAFSTLLDDLDARGLLDETLVVWTGEFGRTPRVGQSVVGGAGAGKDGRDHWPHCFSTVLAGAGIQGGSVYGASDRWAAYPAKDAVTPADIAATIYHVLGIDPATMLRDATGRPMQLSVGEPISAILS